MSKRRQCPRKITTASVTVRCSGALHKIELLPNGRLKFHGHDDSLFLETAVREAGGMPPGCRCEVILRHWRNFGSSTVEREAKKAGLSPLIPGPLWDARKSISYRWHPATIDLTIQLFDECRNNKERKELKLDLLRDIMKARIVKHAEAALREANYRRSTSKWAGGEHDVRVSTVISDSLCNVTIKSVSTKVWSNNGKWSGNNSEILAYVSSDWLSQVHKPGIALVEHRGKKHFVLGAAPTGCRRVACYYYVNKLKPNQAVARVGKQGLGFDVTACWAVIDVNERKIVRWLQTGDLQYEEKR